MMSSWVAVNNLHTSTKRLNLRNFEKDREFITTQASRQLSAGGVKAASFYEVLTRGDPHTPSVVATLPTLGRMYMDFDVGKFPSEPDPSVKQDFFRKCKQNAEILIQAEKCVNPAIPEYRIMWLESCGWLKSNATDSPSVYKVSYHAKVDGFRLSLLSMNNLLQNHKHLMVGPEQFKPDDKVYATAQKFRAPLCCKGSRGRDAYFDTRMLLPVGDPDFPTSFGGSSDMQRLFVWSLRRFHQYTIQAHVSYLPTVSVPRRLMGVSSSDVSSGPAPPPPTTADDDEDGDSLTDGPDWKTIADVLVVAGFDNPYKRGFDWVKRNGKLYLQFQADNQHDCPICGGSHDSDNCYTVVISVGYGVQVMRHSQNCKVRNLVSSQYMGKYFGNFLEPQKHESNSFAPGMVAQMVLGALPPLVYYVEEKKYYVWQECYWRPSTEVDLSGMVTGVFTKETSYTLEVMKKYQRLFEQLPWLSEKEKARLEFLNERVQKFAGIVLSMDYVRGIARWMQLLPWLHKHDDDLTPFCEEIGTYYFDRRKELLHFQNGVIDLSSNFSDLDEPYSLVPSHPWHFNSKTVNFCYSESYNPEKMAYLEHVMRLLMPDEGARHMLQMYAGSCLDGFNDIKKFCVLTDRDDKEALSGNNGKTLFLSLLRNVLGDYGDVANKNVFVSEQKSDSSAAAPSIVKLKGKRMVTVDEPKATTYVAQEQLKTYTDGMNAHVAARGLYQSESVMSWQAKIFFACNSMQFPNFDTMDEAFTNRMMVIPFENVFTLDESALAKEEQRVTRLEPFSVRRVHKADPQLADKLLSEYRLEFMHWLLRGYKMRKLDPQAFSPNQMPNKVKEFTDQLILRKSLIYEFLLTRLRKDPDLEAPASSEREILRNSVNLASISQSWVQYLGGKRVTRVTSVAYVKKMVQRFLSMSGQGNALVDRTTNTHDLNKPPEVVVVRGYRLLSAEDLASGEDFREKRRRLMTDFASDNDQPGPGAAGGNSQRSTDAFAFC